MLGFKLVTLVSISFLILIFFCHCWVCAFALCFDNNTFYFCQVQIIVLFAYISDGLKSFLMEHFDFHARAIFYMYSVFFSDIFHFISSKVTKNQMITGVSWMFCFFIRGSLQNIKNVWSFLSKIKCKWWKLHNWFYFILQVI